MALDKGIKVFDFGNELQECGAREAKLFNKEFIDLLYGPSYYNLEGLETLSCFGEEIIDILSLNRDML